MFTVFVWRAEGRHIISHGVGARRAELFCAGGDARHMLMSATSVVVELQKVATSAGQRIGVAIPTLPPLLAVRYCFHRRLFVG